MPQDSSFSEIPCCQPPPTYNSGWLRCLNQWQGTVIGFFRNKNGSVLQLVLLQDPVQLVQQPHPLVFLILTVSQYQDRTFVVGRWHLGSCNLQRADVFGIKGGASSSFLQLKMIYKPLQHPPPCVSSLYLNSYIANLSNWLSGDLIRNPFLLSPWIAQLMIICIDAVDTVSSALHLCRPLTNMDTKHRKPLNLCSDVSTLNGQCNSKNYLVHIYHGLPLIMNNRCQQVP